MSDGSPLFAADYAQLPTIAVGIAEPKTHVFRSGRFRADFVARIFYIRADALQMVERFPQYRHVGQMKRHMVNRFGRRFPLEQRNSNAVVANGDAIFEIEFLLQSKYALELFRAFFLIAHRQSKVPDFPECKGNFHTTEWKR